MKGPSPGEPAPPRMHVVTHLPTHFSAFLDFGRWILACFLSSPEPKASSCFHLGAKIAVNSSNTLQSRSERPTGKGLRHVIQRVRRRRDGGGREDDESCKQSRRGAHHEARSPRRFCSCPCPRAATKPEKAKRTGERGFVRDDLRQYACHLFFESVPSTSPDRLSSLSLLHCVLCSYWSRS